jgi:hypothetical protein
MEGEEMIGAITVATFLATVFVVVSILYILSRIVRIKLMKNPERQRAERRRSRRSVIYVPVRVFRDATNGVPVFEETTTLEVNAHGGLLTLATSLKTGQKLWLTNRVNQEEQECHVVRLGLERQGKTEVAVEFPRPAPGFWQAEF